MKTNSLETEDPIVQRLNAVTDSSCELRVAARLYEAILPLVRDADLPVSALQLDATKVRACLKKGVPVLSGLELEVDFQELEGLLVRLIRAVASINASEKRQYSWKIWQHRAKVKETVDKSEYQSLSAAAARMQTVYEEGRLDLGEILSFAANGNYGALSEKAAKLQLTPGLLWTLAQNALKPALHSCRQELVPLTTGLHWEKDYCFICGSKAALGELQDNNQVKHLRCGQCGADWYFNRLQCLHCGNVDHQTQQILYAEGYDSRWIEVCDVCHGYLKVITSFTPTAPEMLFVEDLATLHLDFIAQQKGYLKKGVATIDKW